jgi:predicted deacylase
MSEEGLPLQAFYAGASSASLRVLIVAGQHGDERPARQAAAEVLAAASSALLPASLAVIPNLNPDGAARRQRHNARGIDLNRDHQLLAAAETRCLHRFIRSWRPGLVLDVHTYPSRRRCLLAQNLVHCHDIFADVPTSGSLANSPRIAVATQILEPLLAELNAQGFRSARYLRVTDAGRIRHSMTDITDARNGLALRFGIPTLLIEGRQPVTGDGAVERAHLAGALRAALEGAVRWSAQILNNIPADLSADHAQAVPIRARYVRADSPCVMMFKDLKNGACRAAELAGDFCPSHRMTRSVHLPAAYAVPLRQREVLEVLRRHGFIGEPASPQTCCTVEEYIVKEVPQNHGRRMRVDVAKRSTVLADHVLFPVTQVGGTALAVWLEPESAFGLHRYPDMKLAPKVHSPYAVLRVIDGVSACRPAGFISVSLHERE